MIVDLTIPYRGKQGVKKALYLVTTHVAIIVVEIDMRNYENRSLRNNDDGLHKINVPDRSDCYLLSEISSTDNEPDMQKYEMRIFSENMWSMFTIVNILRQ